MATRAVCSVQCSIRPEQLTNTGSCVIFEFELISELAIKICKLTFGLALLGGQDDGADDNQQQRNCRFHVNCKEKEREREWAERKVNTIRARSQQLKRERKEVCVCECEWEGNVRAKAPVEMCMRHNALPLRVCYTNQ